MVQIICHLKPEAPNSVLRARSSQVQRSLRVENVFCIFFVGELAVRFGAPKLAGKEMRAQPTNIGAGIIGKLLTVVFLYNL